MEVYLSTGAFPFNELSAIIEFSISHGIDRIELSSGVAYDPNLLEQVRATNQTQVKYLVHNYFPPSEKPFVLNLASSDSNIQKRSIDLCREAIDLSSELGAPFYSVHSGFAFDMPPDLLGKPVAQRHIPKNAYVSYDNAYDVFKENIIELVKYARSEGVGLMVENNVVSSAYIAENNERSLLMTSADEMMQLLTDVGDSTLGVLVDVGHVNVTAHAIGFRREEFVEALAPHIGAFHLSDNDGYTDQNLSFDHDVWFFPLLRRFSHVPLIVEAYDLTWRQMKQQYRVLNAFKA